eukprot:scaffold14344_cov69-Phaeocystis_antarctica.AAC.8
MGNVTLVMVHRTAATAVRSGARLRACDNCRLHARRARQRAARVEDLRRAGDAEGAARYRGDDGGGRHGGGLVAAAGAHRKDRARGGSAAHRVRRPCHRPARHSPRHRSRLKAA